MLSNVRKIYLTGVKSELYFINRRNNDVHPDEIIEIKKKLFLRFNLLNVVNKS